MPLGEGEKEYLRQVGFIQREIDEFDQARSPSGKPQYINIGSGAWTDAIDSRRQWVQQRRREGWSDWRIRAALEQYYLLGAGRSPWDFIRAEYKPPRRISDYKEARRRRSEAKINRVAGGYRR